MFFWVSFNFKTLWMFCLSVCVKDGGKRFFVFMIKSQFFGFFLYKCNTFWYECVPFLFHLGHWRLSTKSLLSKHTFGVLQLLRWWPLFKYVIYHHQCLGMRVIFFLGFYLWTAVGCHGCANTPDNAKRAKVMHFYTLRSIGNTPMLIMSSSSDRPTKNLGHLRKSHINFWWKQRLWYHLLSLLGFRSNDKILQSLCLAIRPDPESTVRLLAHSLLYRPKVTKLASHTIRRMPPRTCSVSFSNLFLFEWL